jgi:hypothetical protein
MKTKGKNILAASAAAALLAAGAGSARAQVYFLRCDDGGRSASAPASMTAEQAEAAVYGDHGVVYNVTAPATASEQIENAIADGRENFAPIWMAAPYGAERLVEIDEPGDSDVCVRLKQKNAYWQAAAAALESAKPADPESDLQAEIRAEVRRIRSQRMVRAILDDIVVDDALIAGRSGSQWTMLTPDEQKGVMARKKQLFDKLQETAAPQAK